MKRLTEINDELERAVFLSVYYSRQQQQWRLLARWLLMVKHILRGLFYIWPVYLILIALLFLPVSSNRLIFLSLLLPGLLVWLFIYLKGARADYNQLVHEQILEKGFIRKLIWPNL
ncbi:hypothetical protein MNBD_GAMMA25-1452 [hydrothermal vent metagenome]|uniref:Uncharacterized protein n=1 Tax=hydrothermal vent metagenome TaxID=652676 RepID=A0A3B1B478_9ZZZZ